MKLFAPAMVLAALGCNPAIQPSPNDIAKIPAPVAQPSPTKAPSLKADDPIITATNQFGLKLFRQLDTRGNVMISPLSISLALRMAMNGAAGETLNQMNQALGFQGMDLSRVNDNSQALQAALTSDPAVNLSIANSIWTKKGFTFEPSYLDSTVKAYQAKVSDLDFADPNAAKIINGWVNESTNGKISSIVPNPLPSSAVMYLINAVYFKGKWVSPFDTSSTNPEAFTLSDGTTIQTPMMHKKEGGAFTLEGGRTGITMAYKDGAFEMVAILPAERENAPDLIGALAEKDLLGQQTAIPGPVDLSFPKFKASYETVLNDPLAKLGITEAFTDHADFSKMRSARDVSISQVRHKTYIDVTEEGTEAAAVTSIGMRRATAFMLKPRELKFNRPFVYLIRHRESGQVLFLGLVMNPKTS